MPGPVALVGSGEYLPVMVEVERRLLAGRARRYVQLPTAAAPEGAASLDRWIALGREQAHRLGVAAVALPVVDRASADSAELAATVAGAGLVYLSGGSPAYLAATLRGSLVWSAIETAWRAGAALAGCSAGAMALTGWLPNLRDPTAAATPGLGVVPSLRVIPHFDRFNGWDPDAVREHAAATPPDITLVGIDEETALVGGPADWEVQGRQSVWVLHPDGRDEHRAGSRLRLPVPGW